MASRRVVVTLNKGWGESPETVLLCPKEGEFLSDWGVNEKENSSMVAVWAEFQGNNGKQRQQDEWFNSFRLDRVYVEGE